uniref:SCP domain-containing protein n=1 Tax=Suricata suricatta TaxID=37032 RepID=A0A673U4D8_SURSU
GASLNPFNCPWSLLSYGNTAVSLPDIENEDFIKDCVRSHNKFRSEVNPRASDMLYMTWDPVLARVAKTWARNCQFAHNTQLHSSFKLHPNFSSLGENIWAGSLPQFSASSAITAWHNEIEYYEFRTQKCTWVCGHYTQVVWAASYKVGCAVQFCPSIHGTNIHDGAFFICNYGPGLNTNTSCFFMDRTRQGSLSPLFLSRQIQTFLVAYFSQDCAISLEFTTAFCFQPVFEVVIFPSSL